jgi:type I restriction enzyme R subunit
VAFTATPKAKTLELFGRRPDPSQPAGEGNLPEPFHVYSMRQAIEEEFILDVLKNYTSYAVAFKLANGGEELGDEEVERSAAMKRLMSWVRLHPYNIAQKVQVVVEHFRNTIAPLLEGRGKAMVVVGSRKEAVRWKLAIEKYVAENNYAMKTLAAFSGEVNDKESGPEPFKETSKELNADLKGRDIREAFKEDEYRILLVANKFQTGFDQPLLCGMYVDKRLSGIQAVQTLSRLNRCYPGKEAPFVLDFVNDPGEILESFKAYYTTAELSGVTDPNIVLDLRLKLDGLGLYDEHEVDRVVNVVMDPNAKQKQYEAAITPVADRLLKQFAAAKTARADALAAKNDQAAQAAQDEMDSLILFRSDMQTYLRAYTFLSQIFDYGNTDFEKRSIFYRALVRLLKFGREREGVDLSEVKLTHHSVRNRGKQNLSLSEEDTPKLDPLTDAGSGQVHEKEKARLREIIARLNDLFEGELTDSDKLLYVDRVIKEKLLESKILVKQARTNTKEQFAGSPDLGAEVESAIMDALDAHTAMSTQALESKSVQREMVNILLNCSHLYEDLRARASAM